MATPKVFIPFYSRSGTIERLARAVAEGAESEGAEVRLRRARELIGHDIMSSVPGWKESAEEMNARYPAPTPEDAVWADAVIFGTPTRFGNVSSELKAYIDGLGGLWAQGKLNGKTGSVFAGSSQQHGGNESTVISLWNPLAHLGFIIVPTGYADPVMFAGAGSPYGASVISGHPPAGPTEAELAVARFQGRRVTQVAKKLAS
ncbi:MAG TPA: NAD(P)H:quinone oxidoreductase [Rhizomicrobium sp.]|jgi:NAD(P)H dehydrogenase (quinone)|nr:NAD(P)H:quinone oxidoreductase [Rhizomicrobium sp.]